MLDVDIYKKLGVSKQAFHGWKVRRSIPKTQELAVSQIMGVSLEYLKTGIKEATTSKEHITKDAHGNPVTEHLSQLETDILRDLRVLDDARVEIAYDFIHGMAEKARAKEKSERICG